MTLEEKLKRIPEWIYLWAMTEIHNIRARRSVLDIFHQTGMLCPNIQVECISFDNYIKSIDETNETKKASR